MRVIILLHLHLDELENENLIAFKYCDQKGNINEASNPNGSMKNIAGIFNSKKYFRYDATS